MNNKVLVIEDDKNLGKVLTDYLTSKNYLVQLAEDGEIGFDFFTNNDYDIIILDVGMEIRYIITNLCKRTHP